jgi:hypothetical protein
MIKSRVKAVLTFGVTVEHMVAAANVHGDFRNGQIAFFLVISLDKLT